MKPLLGISAWVWITAALLCAGCWFAEVIQGIAA